MSAPADVYRPRNPQSSDYYRCVEDYFETFVRVYDEHFSRQYGFWRPYVQKVIYRYLDCGDLHNGFARVKSATNTSWPSFASVAAFNWQYSMLFSPPFRVVVGAIRVR